ncbi:MAG: Peptidylprolyl isomerase [Candidatus Kaiserbacteria bacterium GW2011_GWB1_52_6]|uniref:Peptidyl-prolyl cis-trans isomerase n=2 Tax=Candidatus Kaiseribacteriota TaxID=1752734 RepID=A0A0G1XHH2_9BACT|nr:MAG: Peptidylprolyl isomerase [Candidatus Kaiserbacteria bacterium GW2011_GWB1_52_6]KKW30678.1 MAG: Peptidylprolyl isomerase [Candidatus Kaiserbacteria bacterium GW2011_GWC2_52_8b]
MYKTILIVTFCFALLAGGYLYFARAVPSTVAGQFATSTLAFSDPTANTASASEGQTAAVSAPAQVSEQPAITTPSNEQSKENNMMNAVLHTNKGDITIEFLAADAPNTVANFIKLAEAGFYDGTKFHRVIKGFMIQGGDPLTKDDSQIAKWGTGGPGYQFADELRANNHNDIGTIAMANSGPNTNGSQFFINVKDNSFLNTKHTVFSKVTAGMDVVIAIENVATGQSDRPVEPVVITNVTFQ